MEFIKRGGYPIRLSKPARLGDGIVKLPEEIYGELIEGYEKAAAKGRVAKMVPASGAASRMFRDLLCVYHDEGGCEKAPVTPEPSAGNSSFLEFIGNIQHFPFFDSLKDVMKREGHDIHRVLSDRDYSLLLEYVLSPKGLDYGQLPKGLILFHGYGHVARTAFEEHLAESVYYLLDAKREGRIHFTVPASHLELVRERLESAAAFFEKQGMRLSVSLSIQKPSTDTVAVGMDHGLLRDEEGKLIFYPTGHGALLENLNDLKGDIVFLKNIDNVVPDRLKPETCRYKKILGGYLVKIQNEVFDRLEKLGSPHVDGKYVDEIFGYAEKTLFIRFPASIRKAGASEKAKALRDKLNRPIRVCGMVRNQGEPGGGPFWVREKDGTESLQIVEQSQVDKADEGQQKLCRSSTHFNPVDLVCGVRNGKGSPFDLKGYADPKTSFVSLKSRAGQLLKVLELPGLWNGGMARWTTIFVEMPLETFNPVKVVNDLLRPQHQP